MSLDRSRNVLGGAAPFYRCYMCADGREIAVGPIEPQFYQTLIGILGASDDLLKAQRGVADWPAQADMLAAIFRQRTCAEWCALLEGTDACFAPVLDLPEAIAHPHMTARATYVEADGRVQAAPAPRFSRTPGAIQPAADAETMLARWGAPA